MIWPNLSRAVAITTEKISKEHSSKPDRITRHPGSPAHLGPRSKASGSLNSCLQGHEGLDRTGPDPVEWAIRFSFPPASTARWKRYDSNGIPLM